MRGRLENKIKTETYLEEKLSSAPEYLKRFYFYLGQKSHTTKHVYLNNVIRFLTYKDNKFPALEELEGISSYDVQLYISEIKYYKMDKGDVRELKETSQAIIYSSLSSFFTFLNRVYRIKTNPFDEKIIERPKTRENDIVYLTPEEVKIVEANILSGVGNKLSASKQKDWKYRDILLFRIPIVNGLRVTALSEINVEDVNIATRKITVTEKGNITKTVDFDAKTATYMQIWLKQRRELLGDNKDEKALFISNRRTRMVVRSIENIISKYTSCIEGKHITPHKLRSTCGTNTYRVSGDIYLVSKVLGHKTTAPTRRYAAVLDSDKTNVINKVAELY